VRLPRFFNSRFTYAAAILLTAAILCSRAQWEHERITAALAPYVKEAVPFKIYRPDNRNKHYIEDLLRIHVSSDATKIIILRYVPKEDELQLPIESATLQPNNTLMVLTRRKRTSYRIYLNPENFMLSAVSDGKHVAAVETGRKISPDEVKQFEEDPLYKEID
jgi:hypothetical protein